LSSTSKRLALAALALLTTNLPAWAAPRTYRIQADSTISYSGKHPAHQWTGVSRSLRGTFAFDAEAPALVSPVTVSIPVRSFDSGNRNRDSNALAILDAGRHPQVSLRIDRLTAIKREASGTSGSAVAEGLLTFHGVAKPISFPITAQLVQDRLQAQATFPVSVTAFGIERPKLLFVPIEDTVMVKVTFSAKAE
jgi:polyisoprenoid-binding protein YceI